MAHVPEEYYCQLKESNRLKNNNITYLNGSVKEMGDNIQQLLQQNEKLTLKCMDTEKALLLEENNHVKTKDIVKEMETMLIHCKREIDLLAKEKNDYATKVWDYEHILKEKGLL